MREIYFAKSENQLGEKETVDQHLDRVGELCGKFLEPIGYENWGEAIGKLHDVGKIGELFQQVLDHQRIKVNHALPGAVLAFNIYRARRETASLFATVIANHHGQLKSGGFEYYRREFNYILKGIGRRIDRENYELSLFGMEEYNCAFEQWSKYFQVEKELNPPPDFRAAEDKHLAKMLFTRFLYSAIIDADWTSSAEHDDPDYLVRHTGPKLDAAAALERVCELRRKKQTESTASVNLNELRDRLFDACMEAGEHQAPGLFTLTAPTGLGKTLSLFAFAASHCKKWGKRRIILILPFLAIIDQNCRDYRAVLPELLEIHSNVEWNQTTSCLAERWDVPCIITTSVGFFEPLFSARAGECRHLHQLTDSVIVLDEAQSLPDKLLDATLRTMKELSEHYGCTVVFSTATQPSFQHRTDLKWQPREIAPDPPSLFAATRRTTWEWRVDRDVPLCELANEIAELPQCCVIVNKKAHARKLLDYMLSCLPKSGIFFMTTDLCPAHREDTLNEIHFRLSRNLPCCLVATQCIEAGVDLDFPVVYRALAPLDALIQAAGRCNRNGDSPDGRMIIFVPDEEGALYPTEEYGRGAMCVRILLERHPIDFSNLAHIDEYYRILYGNGGGDKKALMDAIKNEDFQEVEKQYRMIDNGGVQVIVPYSGRREVFLRIRDRLDQEGLSTELLREARGLIVSSYDRKHVTQYCQQLYLKRNGEYVPTEYYLLANQNFYDDKRGLYFDKMFDGIV